MRSLPLFLWAMVLTAGLPPAAHAPDGHIRASLLAATEQPRPGQQLLLGFRMAPEPGWHGYWSNPGESGLPPSVEWEAPPGLTFGPLVHSAPTILTVSGLISYVHAGEHVLLARVRVGSSLQPGTPLPIEARLQWLACSESLCVPEKAILALNLVVGSGSPGSSAGLLQLAEQRLPQRIGAGQFDVHGGKLRLRLPAAAEVEPASARFFPDQDELLFASSALTRVADGTTEFVGHVEGPVPARISGVVSDGRNAYRLSFGRAALGSSRAQRGTQSAEPDRPVTAAPEPESAKAARAERPAGGASARRTVPATMTITGIGTPLLGALAAVIVAGLLLRRSCRGRSGSWRRRA